MEPIEWWNVMTKQAARIWLIKASLSITGVTFVFFLLSPALGYPLSFEQSIRLLEIVTPVFLGYLGSATTFLFGKETQMSDVTIRGPKELLQLLVKGPVYVFGIATLAAMVAFGYSNRTDALSGSGMSVDLLAGGISAALGLLAVTTNIIVSYLFSSGESQ